MTRMWSGWRLLGWKKLAGVFAFGALALVVLTFASSQVRQRIERTAHVLTADEQGVDSALAGRTRIWGAALRMAGEHPVNGVGVGIIRRGGAAAWDVARLPRHVACSSTVRRLEWRVEQLTSCRCALAAPCSRSPV